MCSADTFCDMSRMRRRYFLQRALAAAASKVMARLDIGLVLPLFDDGPVVVAGIASLLEDLDPAFGVVVEPRGQHPVLEDGLLLRRAVGIDLHEGAAARNPL